MRNLLFLFRSCQFDIYHLFLQFHIFLDHQLGKIAQYLHSIFHFFDFIFYITYIKIKCIF